MTDSDSRPAGWDGYRALGLVANPYLASTGRESETVGIRLEVRASALGLLTSIEEALSSERPRPVRVLKPSNLPGYYPRSAMTAVLRELGSQSATGLLPVYVPLLMMRKGRIRGTLSMLAELVCGREIDTTIARYAKRALGDPDTSLPEWEAVETLDVPGLLGGLEKDPQAVVAAWFGAPVDIREEDAAGTLEEVMRESGMRQVHQPVDPPEDADTSEEDAAERVAALVPGEDETQDEVEGEAPEEDPAAQEADAVARYVIAHMKKHTSPVLARGLRAYVKSGTAAMTEELKITRAPRKTLGALAGLARLTFRSVVIIYDGFEAWDDIPGDLRATIVSGLSEIRLALGSDGVIVIAGSDAEAPEIDDQFATAVRVSWAMSEVERVQEAEIPYDADLLARWLRAATLPGADTSALWRRVEQACEGSEDLASGVALAAEVIEEAARETVSANS